METRKKQKEWRRKRKEKEHRSWGKTKPLYLPTNHSKRNWNAQSVFLSCIVAGRYNKFPTVSSYEEALGLNQMTGVLVLPASVFSKTWSSEATLALQS